ncbi:MAG TPA: tRNA (N(6)-L-threonylcarbamoyladenosine(37)-C(2))-methylthiotransferase MtaB [Candidatus Egerieisoma faecipullorum]|uniref:Threonylcarbamoyladenosine tRNA methylthiotransferase MtaB n=1 Tax=Candidatus Egerieisoma faecipullorum TaxID=2840963 RepID=A0A9D1I6W3_9CLOT|nr:tRNA (N(6)-L-threonylcarbamoyladenosine(37)-C(2))-methylthiotransferase MtaB [Candidatus Egerieisoma faecipullorum]
MEKKQYTAAIYTLGCKVNFYESEAIAAALAARGVELREFDDICDIYVVNTCTVTADSDRKALRVVRRAIHKNPNAFIAVTGCLAQTRPELISKIEGVTLITGNENKTVVAERILAAASSGCREQSVSILPFSHTLCDVSVDTFHRTRAYIKIEDGCGARCSYCIIPTARGPVRSKPRAAVLREVRTLVNGGCKEIVLTGIEISSYQFDLLALLSELDRVDGLERIRLGSLDPFFIRKDVADALKTVEKLCPHFHISLQSGSSKILAAMRRRYNSQTAMEQILYLKSLFPDCNLFADVITGFPGETEEDFLETVRFLEAVRFLHVHIFPYSQRSGTAAAQLEGQIPKAVKKQRAAQLASMQASIKASLLSEFVSSGKKANVLFETWKDGFLKGHSENFIEFVCASDQNLRGKTGTVIPLSTDGETVTGYLSSSSSSASSM